MKIETIAERAASYGIPGERIDGNDATFTISSTTLSRVTPSACGHAPNRRLDRAAYAIQRTRPRASLFREEGGASGVECNCIHVYCSTFEVMLNSVLQSYS